MPGPQKFNRKPATADAYQLTSVNIAEVALWCGGRVTEAVNSGEPSNNKPAYLSVPTIEGVKVANLGDYITKEPTGDFKISKQAEFEARWTPGPPTP